MSDTAIIYRNAIVADTALTEFLTRRGPFDAETIATLTQVKVRVVALAAAVTPPVALTERAVRATLNRVVATEGSEDDVRQQGMQPNGAARHEDPAEGQGRQPAGLAGGADGDGPPVDARAWDPGD